MGAARVAVWGRSAGIFFYPECSPTFFTSEGRFLPGGLGQLAEKAQALFGLGLLHLVHGESGMDNDIVPDSTSSGSKMPETVRQVGPLPTVAFNMPSSDFSMTFAGMARHIMSPFADFRPRGNGGFHKTDAVRGK